MHRAPAAVLDTNVALDWLLFRDARSAALQAALEAGAVRWLACERMREEFRRVLARPALGRWLPSGDWRKRLLHAFDERADAQAEPPPAPAALRCDDPDDQVFVDLALASGARWLVSRDKAVLRLRRHATRHGLHIVDPGGWVFADAQAAG